MSGKRVVVTKMAELAALEPRTRVEVRGQYLLLNSRTHSRLGVTAAAWIKLDGPGLARVVLAVPDDFHPLLAGEVGVFHGVVPERGFFTVGPNELAVDGGELVELPERAFVWIAGEVRDTGPSWVMLEHWHQPVEVEFKSRAHDFVPGDVILAEGFVKQGEDVSVLGLAEGERIEDHPFCDGLDVVEREFLKAMAPSWKDSFDDLRALAKTSANVAEN